VYFNVKRLGTIKAFIYPSEKTITKSN